MSLTRRGLLKGILAAGFAPAAVGSGILMPVKKILTLDDFKVIVDTPPNSPWEHLKIDSHLNGYRVYRNNILIAEGAIDPMRPRVDIPFGGTKVSFNAPLKNGQTISMWARHNGRINGMDMTHMQLENIRG